MEAVHWREGKDDAELWDRFVLSSPSGHLFQTWEWGRVSGALGWEPLRIAVRENGEIKAVAQILIRRKGPFSILYVPRGPVFSCRGCFELLIFELKKVMRKERGVFLKINPAIEKPGPVEAWYSENGLRVSDVREMHICTYLIDLRRSADEIWNDFSHMVQKGVRKAQREGVTVEKGDRAGAVEEFYALYAGRSLQKGISCHSMEFVKEVWEAFAPRGQAEIYLAKYQGKPIAGEFMLMYGDRCEEMWAGAVEEYLNLRPYQLLHWEIFQDMKKRGCVLYNMGGVPPSEAEAPGMRFYKGSFGGRFSEFLGEYEAAGNPLMYWLWKKTEKVYRGRKGRAVR